MQSFQVQQQFGLDNLRITERLDPRPGPGEVLVKIHACSLNYRDYLMITGAYNPRQKLPMTPVSDGAGEVVEIGADVTEVTVGDRVAGLFSQHWLGGEPNQQRLRSSLGGPVEGMLSELVVLPQHGVIPLPSHLSFAEGATLPCAALTAWSAMTKYRQVKAGDVVLLQGTGGVSLFALQFAKLLGARVIITSSSDKKLARAQALGADHLINYRNDPDWHKTARALTNKQGVDHIVEVGGAETFEKSMAAVRIGGFIAVIGVLSGVKAPISVIPMLMSSLHVQGVTVGSRDDFIAMNKAISQHQLKPVIDQRFAFTDAPDAFRLMERGGHFGKIVIGIPN